MKYTYYKLDHLPCRVEHHTDGSKTVERYQSGTGFVPESLLEIEFEGIPITKQEFDAIIMKMIRVSAPAD